MFVSFFFVSPSHLLWKFFFRCFLKCIPISLLVLMKNSTSLAGEKKERSKKEDPSSSSNTVSHTCEKSHVYEEQKKEKKELFLPPVSLTHNFDIDSVFTFSIRKEKRDQNNFFLPHSNILFFSLNQCRNQSGFSHERNTDLWPFILQPKEMLEEEPCSTFHLFPEENPLESLTRGKIEHGEKRKLKIGIFMGKTSSSYKKKILPHFSILSHLSYIGSDTYCFHTSFQSVCVSSSSSSNQLADLSSRAGTAAGHEIDFFILLLLPLLHDQYCLWKRKIEKKL